MQRVTGLSDEQVHLYELQIEAVIRVQLQMVMDRIADHIASIQTASALVLVAAEQPPADSVPAGDGLPPGQPYVSPDDLAEIPPLWQEAVAQAVLPIAAEVFQAASGAVHAQMVDAVGHALPSVGSIAAEQYLAQARNTFDDIGNDLWETARNELLDGFERGESIPQLAERLRSSAGMTAKTATLVGRTKVIEASNAGSIATARASMLDMVKEWIATPDVRTRPTHLAADGQRVPLAEKFTVGGFQADFPADPDLPPAESYNCFPAGTPVVAPNLEVAYRRPYDGVMVTVLLASGDELTATPNHPVLTDVGWRALGEVDEGCHLIRCHLGEKMGLGDPDIDDVPADIDQVFGALYEVGPVRRVAARDVDFHGDGSDGEIEVVWADGQLRDARIAEFGQPVPHLSLPTADALESSLHGQSSSDRLARVDVLDSSGGVGGSREGAPLFVVGGGHPLIHGSASAAELDSGIEQPVSDDSSADIEISGEGLFGLPGQVTFDKIVNVERYAFHGDVFNLQTHQGWYTANGVVVRNCRCTVGYVIPDEQPDLVPIDGAPGTTTIDRAIAEQGIAPPDGTTTVERALEAQEALPRLPGTDVDLGELVEASTIVRPVLARAKTERELQAAWRAEFQRIAGRDVLIQMPPNASLKTMGQYAEGTLQALERFPEAKIGEISWWSAPGKAYAQVTPGGRHGATLQFNAWWASNDNRAKLLRAMRGDTKGWDEGRSAWSVRGATSPTSTAYHEFAHVLDLENLGGRVGPQALAVVRRNAIREGVDEDALVSRDISFYAGSDVNEMIAEAFTDVMVNGPRASLVSREIYDLMVVEYRRGGFAIRSAPIDELAEEAARAFPRLPASRLNSMTVAQLRALAKERGVTIPTGARKADLVRLLDEGVTPPDVAKPVASATSKLTITALRKLAKERGIDVPAGMRKADLVKLIDEAPKPSPVGVAGQQQLDQMARRASTGQEERLGRDTDAIVTRIKFPDGTSVIRKSYDRPGKLDRATATFRADAEELGALVARTMGIRAPKTTRVGLSSARSRDSLFMQDMTGITGREAGLSAVSEPDRHMVGLLDILIGQSDRNTDNWLISAGKIEVIDHGRAFLSVYNRRTRRGLPSADSWFTKPFVRRRSGDDVGFEIADSVPVAPEDLAIIRTRLESLGGEFERLGRSDWHQQMMDDLAALERAATGGSPRLPLGGIADVAPDLTPAQIQRAAARARNAQIESSAGTARLLAEVDEIIAKGANRTALRQTLDDALITPEQLFAGADPAVLDALKTALATGDMAKLKAAVTRLSTKAKIKVVGGKAGAKVKFDADTMEGVGGIDIPAGAQVTVVRRGSTVTMPDGEVVTLEKARVTPVAPKPRPQGIPQPDLTVAPEHLVRSVREALKSANFTEIDAYERVKAGMFFRTRGHVDVGFLQGFQHDYPAVWARLVQEGRAESFLDRRIEHFGITGTREQIKARIEANMAEQLAGAKVVVRRANESSLRDILERGRMRTQFETKTSGGDYAPAKRARFEEAIWGYGRRSDPTLRPVYGYMSPLGDESVWPVGQYGGIRIVLKDVVRSRTSFVMGDSLGARGIMSPLDSPKWSSYGTFRFVDPTKPTSFWTGDFQKDVRYVEAQIHGGVTVDDIAEVILDSAPSKETIEALKRAGVPWRRS